MSAVRFEMLSIMHTLHAVGLMPEDIYLRERDRLVMLLTEERWHIGPLDFAEWTQEANHPVRYGYFCPTERDGANYEFDWRFLISDFLKSAYGAVGAAEAKAVVESEICRLDVSAVFPQACTVSSSLLKDEQLHRFWISMLQESNNEHNRMQSEVASLRDEVKRLHREVIAIGQKDQATVSRENSQSNKAQIADFQAELAKCFTSAAMREAEGNQFLAAQWRGRAAELESKLRALGA